MKKKMRKIFAFIILVISVFVAMNLSNILTTNLESWNELIANLLGSLFQIILFIGGLFLCTKVEGETLESYGIQFDKGELQKLLIGLVIGFSTFIVVSSPLYFVNAYILKKTEYSLNKILIEFFIFIAVGFIEEYFCRGFIQHHLIRIGAIPALLLTSMIFGLVHLGNPGITFLAIINIFFAGCFMGSVMYAFNSIHAAVGVHITWNWIQGAIFGIPVSGTSRSGFFSTIIVSNNEWLTGGDFGAEGSIVCTAILIILTIVFLYISRKNGNIHTFLNRHQIS